MLATLDRVLTQGLPEVEVTLVTERARRTAMIRESAHYERIGAATAECVSRLMEALAAAGATPDGPLTGLFPLDLAQQITIAVAAETEVPVPGTSAEVMAGGLGPIITTAL